MSGKPVLSIGEGNRMQFLSLAFDLSLDSSQTATVSGNQESD